jgi:hypothetical protein
VLSLGLILFFVVGTEKEMMPEEQRDWKRRENSGKLKEK